MNRNNLSWVDNKVFSNPGSTQNATPQLRPYTDTAPAQYQAAPNQTGVSPATYQETPKTSTPTGVSPATYQEAPKTSTPTGVSPATYQEAPKTSTPTGVSPATYQEPKTSTPTGVSPATYQEAPKTSMPMGVSPATYTAPKAPQPTGVSPATYQNMTAGNPNQTGLSPAQYQAPSNMLNQMGVSPAQYQAPANMLNQMGVSPAQYQADPPVVYPVQTGLPAAGTAAGGVAGASTGMGMPSTLTRDVTYGPSPTVEGPPTVMDTGYIPAYLKSQIGKRVRAEFSIGGNLYTDRTGILTEVGYSYFVLEDLITRATIMCDLYSLKFLTSL
ncbi:hypothetical protein SAMN02745823_01159 [Sporobacter termitidis DSM 10068]|uniref:Uncharacterized protein n=1 Tax=Sporobacter termitidis DSM 10068 TaxID=1123282 RepID=A0A1M5WAS7_9FIRM|nr:hypothetical protein [Sporobacter termitidis]SHH84550.1 hypothetical protein SAMN02745823_01159 [Sporobacter termitidis DSM 10068]